MRKLLLTVALLVTLVCVTGLYSNAQASVLRLPHEESFSHMTTQEKIHYLKRQKWHDNSIIRWWHNNRELASSKAASDVRWARKSLKIVKSNLHKLTAVGARIASSGVIAALLCIHRYEGSWTDPGSPYWGGLQMDLSFQQAYGGYYLRRLGTADHWPISIQLQVAAKAVRSRGYSPWPKTARLCGLY